MNKGICIGDKIHRFSYKIDYIRKSGHLSNCQYNVIGANDKLYVIDTPEYKTMSRIKSDMYPHANQAFAYRSKYSNLYDTLEIILYTKNKDEKRARQILYNKAKEYVDENYGRYCDSSMELIENILA